MFDPTFLAAVLDSLNQPILVAGTDHKTLYMNKAAIAYYKGGTSLLGQSLLECHNPESQQKIIAILAAFEGGEDECLYAENEQRRMYMHSVRDPHGALIGYYEWYYWKDGASLPGDR